MNALFAEHRFDVALRNIRIEATKQGRQKTGVPLKRHKLILLIGVYVDLFIVCILLSLFA